MNRRERRFYERKQDKIVTKKRDQIINFLEKKFPTDEDKIAYIKKLQEELKNPFEVQELDNPFGVTTDEN